ncbi:MAG: hypothetical protein E6700_01125 [Winkia neuii]|uniref:Type II secretion system protein GspF domain-containing protein n=1 Tax=Winkia neuii TaxID=33007 RepID=A0A2I1IPV4_9ACTO|nr:hypothetical protein [Winkia neuii]OFJ72152.1 hypothetical protein HMPREF2851_04280 [Actinomyces sp. HMSC064C12]OFK02172.1 hypothetical protein HMPREF2835_07515 [Actinomyces sp. HMSC072A03]OFT54636.1 hypothetical protein HMPREF3152_09200 [Actinomyces sp. HMSC06A08]KWZ74211.1 hypothetical protein HMPREF3198_00769 [Winkia neuii]MDK8098641.1 hypothetical protein [Winkia neuii]
MAVGSLYRKLKERFFAPTPDLAAVADELAARLAAGQGPARAWAGVGAKVSSPQGVRWGHAGGSALLKKLIGRGPGSQPAEKPGPLPPALQIIKEVSEQVGIPLVSLLERLGQSLRQDQAAAAERRISLAGPRSSARLLAALPLLGMVLGWAIGAPPWVVLFGSKAGLVLAAAGAFFEAAGLYWIHKLLDKAHQSELHYAAGLSVPLWCDLASACIKVGTSVPAALMALGKAGKVDDLQLAGRMLVLGAPMEQVRAECSPKWRLLWDALEPSWNEGLSPVRLLARAGQSARLQAARKAREGAAVLAVRLVMPLALCLLPAFICTGVLPIVLSQAKTLLS